MLKYPEGVIETLKNICNIPIDRKMNLDEVINELKIKGYGIKIVIKQPPENNDDKPGICRVIFDSRVYSKV
jgi:hypothetical protein